MDRLRLTAILTLSALVYGCARTPDQRAWRGWDEKYDTRDHTYAESGPEQRPAAVRGHRAPGTPVATAATTPAQEQPNLLTVGASMNNEADADERPADDTGVNDNGNDLDDWWTPERKVAAFNIGSAAAIAIFGTLSWDYGTQSWRCGKEGWFGRDTGSGGADKLGHAWAFYAATNAYTVLFEHWGMEREDAIKNAAFSAWLQGLLVEIGDGFDRTHGFSYEDLVSNTAGIAFAYLRLKYPRLYDTVDFRLEWIPTSHFLSRGRLDPFTDYDGQKYLLAFRVGNILKSDSPILQAMEIHTGYYTRNFTAAGDGRPKRYAYAAVGLDVTYLLEQTIDHDAWNLFRYFQVPYTYVPARYSID